MDDGTLRLGNGDLKLEVSRFGGSLLSATFRGIPFLEPSEAPGLAAATHGRVASFPLVPFGNRIEHNGFVFAGRDHALFPNTGNPLVLHGFGWLAEWQLVSSEAGSIVLRHRQPASDDHPYAYEAVQDFRVEDDAVTLSLAVTNHGGAVLPFGLGQHPYFPRTPFCRLTARATRRWKERDNNLPGNPFAVAAPLDFSSGAPIPGAWENNAYEGWNGQARIDWPEHRLALRITTEPAVGYFMIYTPAGDAPFFCFEPMTHLPNGFHMPGGGGLRALAPGESFGFSMRMALVEG